uniref:Uncharacterized protein n=1 Tax=Rhizophagus irregularis (strain DAOM 181602 / DAOM 197198 / MUCL 43194) TaxID=747089 RepID=U9UML9_RHIID
MIFLLLHITQVVRKYFLHLIGYMIIDLKDVVKGLKNNNTDNKIDSNDNNINNESSNNNTSNDNSKNDNDNDNIDELT